MGHSITYNDYPGTVDEREILADLNEWAYDPEETWGYHGNIKFHKGLVFDSREEAYEAIKSLDKGWYDDHAVYYRAGGSINWLVKVEYHC